MIITKKDRKKIRSLNKNDSDRLFNAAWREVLKYSKDGDIESLEQLNSIYNMIVAQKVNNQNSSFYMYGK